MALGRILATLHDDQGRIAIDGFYDDVLDWDRETRDAIRDLPFDEDDFAKPLGASPEGGEPGYSVLERLWIRPTCEVNGLLSGYTGEGAKTVLPAEAMAKVSFRLVSDQNPQRVAELFRAHVASATPPGVTVTVEQFHGGMPWAGTARRPSQRSGDLRTPQGLRIRSRLSGRGWQHPDRRRVRADPRCAGTPDGLLPARSQPSRPQRVVPRREHRTRDSGARVSLRRAWPAAQGRRRTRRPFNLIACR